MDDMDEHGPERMRLVARTLDGIAKENCEPGNTRRGILGEPEIDAIETARDFIRSKLPAEPFCAGGRCVA